MSEEIKEILDNLKEWSVEGNLYFEINDEKAKKLYNYITNLQQENKQLKEEKPYLYTNTEWEDILEYQGKSYIELDRFKTIQQENKQLKELCDKYEEEHKKEFNIWLQGQKVLKDLEEWLKEEQERYRDYLSTRPKNDSEYNSKYATQCALSQVDIILDKIQELKEKYK